MESKWHFYAKAWQLPALEEECVISLNVLVARWNFIDLVLCRRCFLETAVLKQFEGGEQTIRLRRICSFHWVTKSFRDIIRQWLVRSTIPTHINRFTVTLQCTHWSPLYSQAHGKFGNFRRWLAVSLASSLSRKVANNGSLEKYGSWQRKMSSSKKNYL
jgi:hypothetical protein